MGAKKETGVDYDLNEEGVAVEMEFDDIVAGKRMGSYETNRKRLVNGLICRLTRRNGQGTEDERSRRVLGEKLRIGKGMKKLIRDLERSRSAKSNDGNRASTRWGGPSDDRRG